MRKKIIKDSHVDPQQQSLFDFKYDSIVDDYAYHESQRQSPPPPSGERRGRAEPAGGAGGRPPAPDNELGNAQRNKWAPTGEEKAGKARTQDADGRGRMPKPADPNPEPATNRWGESYELTWESIMRAVVINGNYDSYKLNKNWYQVHIGNGLTWLLNSVDFEAFKQKQNNY